MTAHLDRAYVLFEQSRPDLAEGELRQALLADPNHPMAHALLALCLLQRKEYDQATDEVEQAIHLAPELPFAHYVLASVLHERNHYTPAEVAIAEAIRLDPLNPQFHASRASILFSQKRWAEALAAAEDGLRLNPEHVSASNLRAMALVKLGRKEEAGQTMQAVLARDPEDALSHANMGWTCLEKNDHKKALEHFREALRLDPSEEWARAGLVQALQARYFLYRIMLRYFLWMSKLSGMAQWGVIIGLFVGNRVLRNVANQNPELAPFLWPILYLYIAFVVMTWTAVPLANLLLRFNRFGRYALSRDQLTASNWVAGCLLVAVAGLAWWLVGADAGILGLLTALAAGLLIMPVSAIFSCDAGWPRVVMGLYSFALAVVYVGGIVLTLIWRVQIFEQALLVFFIGIFIAPWLVNGLSSVTVRH